MAYNNNTILTGNLGSEARIIATDESTFAAVSLATTDSYQDDDGNWHDKETVWHNILAFNPRVIEELKALKKGVRIQVTGSLSYRPFEVVNGDGEVITKKEASIIAGKVELATLTKKAKKTPEAV
jgi:single-stranded DNA-binding protein